MTRKVNQVLWDQWRQRMKRQRESWRSIAEFCRREKVSPQSFHAGKRDLVTIEPGALLDRAATLMLDYGISWFPVVADVVLVGILTNTDLHVVLQILVQTLRESSPEDSVTATA